MKIIYDDKYNPETDSVCVDATKYNILQFFGVLLVTLIATPLIGAFLLILSAIKRKPVRLSD